MRETSTIRQYYYSLTQSDDPEEQEEGREFFRRERELNEEPVSSLLYDVLFSWFE